MMSVLISLVLTLRSCLRSRATLQLEVLALRHQLQVLERSRRCRLRLAGADRLLWVGLKHVWHEWRLALVIVKPETVIAWHRRGFRLFWRWKSRRHMGRPSASAAGRTLIRTMSKANPLWGAPRIHGELLKLGIDVCQATVAKYMVRWRQPPSQTWRTFLTNHKTQLTAADFFVVPTVTCRLLFVLVMLAHDRRHSSSDRGLDRPTAPRGVSVGRGASIPDPRSRSCVRRPAETAKAMGIHEVLTAPHAPWQNAFVERFIGSARRECVDHVIVFNEAGLQRVMNGYCAYYERSRTHLSLDKDTPIPRPIAKSGDGGIVAIPQIGGLHHRYERRAA
jgi:putative transposase